MAEIGSLGTPREPVDLSFDYFGLKIRVHPDASDLDLMEFLAHAAEVDELDDAQGSLAISRFLHQLIHPDDWDTFWRASKANRQLLADLLQTARDIMAGVAAFPTGQPSDSSVGRPSTTPRSGGGSLSREADTRAAMRLLDGRPDLKLIVAEAYEAQAG